MIVLTRWSLGRMTAAAGMVLLSALTARAAAFSGESGDTFVDTTVGMRVLGGDTITVCYGPEVSGGLTGSVDHVVVRQVVNVDTPNVTTNERFVSTSRAIDIGSCAVSRAVQGDFQRWIHTSYDSSGKAVGEPLVADFALPLTSAASAEVAVDTRTNSLDLAVREDADNVPLVYSTSWATNGTPVRIEIASSGRGTETRELSAAAPADGVHAYSAIRPKTGVYTLTYSVFDASDDVIDTCSVSYFYKNIGGTLIMLR